MATEYSFDVTRADNGWVIRTRNSYNRTRGDTIVVKDDENLAEAIAAALVAGKLMTDSPAQQTIIGYTTEQLKQLYDQSVLGVGTNTIGTSIYNSSAAYPTAMADIKLGTK